MIGLGIIAASKRRSTPAGGPVVATWISEASSGEDASSYTLAVPAGTPGIGTLVGVAARKSSPPASITAVTIGGQPATILAHATEGGSTAAIAWAPVDPTSGPTVTVTTSDTVRRCGIGAWATDGQAVVLATSTTAAGGTVATRAGSSVAAAAAGVNNLPVTATGLTLHHEGEVGNEASRMSYASALGDGNPLAVSVSPTTTALAVVALA